MTSYETTLSERRQELELSQEPLAGAVGVSRQTIVNIERGLNEPRITLALALAAVVGVAVQQRFRRGLLT